MPKDALAQFDLLTRQWFAGALGRPTAAQALAWPSIAAGRHTLVSAPTGTGKTLSAFLVFLDRMLTRARRGELADGLQLIYISPLKALAGDIRENLRRPLDGILRAGHELGMGTEHFGSLSIAVRTGDTSPADRRRMIKKPPHILITTPESLYLLISGLSGQKMLQTAQSVIIDELHALISTKRGAHLMLTLARLDALCGRSLQRIGLSATIEPTELAARYLSPGEHDPVNIVNPEIEKRSDIRVTSPLSQGGDRPDDPGFLPEDAPAKLRPSTGSIWPDMARAVYEHCEGTRSVIAFTDGRLFAEKLAYYVNQIAGADFARTHHGSISKEHRHETEMALRRGELRLLCATSSMELGIDVGDIDRVLQIGCPPSVSGVLQRLGRAGHSPGRVSVMHIFPKTTQDGLYCGLTAAIALEGGIEHARPPRLCLDVLAQHLVSMATGEGYTVDDVMELLPHAYPFRQVTRQDVLDTLDMLAGDYEHLRDVPVRPRILYDRIHETVEGDAYSRMLALQSGGTIPDMGYYTVRLGDGTKLGELDEEYVFEARVGDKLLLGSFSWKIDHIDRDTVTVTPATQEGALPPFWKGYAVGRDLRTGRRFGQLLGELSETVEADAAASERNAPARDTYARLRRLNLDAACADGAEGYLRRQYEATGTLPTDRLLICEHFTDEQGDHQLMVHSVFGRRINAPLAQLLKHAAEQRMKVDVSVFDTDDGILLYPYGGNRIPEGLLQAIDPAQARALLEALLPATSVFNMAFRYNTGRALLMGVRQGKRQPLWVQRLRSAEMLNAVVDYPSHPIIRETRRECLEDYWDIEGLAQVLREIRAGFIAVRELSLDAPSPMSLPMRRQAEANLLYDYHPTPSGIHAAAETALSELEQSRLLAPAPDQLARVSRRPRLPEDEKQLHSLLMTEGDLQAGELELNVAWLEALARAGRAEYIEPGLWIAMEQRGQYLTAGVGREDDPAEDAETVQGARMAIVRRCLRYRGAHTLWQLCLRYDWPEPVAAAVLDALVAERLVITGADTAEDTLYYHAELYERARRETVKHRRAQTRTQPAESYAAYLAARLRKTGPAAEQLDMAVKSLCDQPHPPALWESVLLPTRVGGYREALLDTLLAQGEVFWSLGGEGLSFHRYEDIDWDTEPPIPDELTDAQRLVYDALTKRGASFLQGLSGLLGGASPHDTLLELAGQGLAHADTFTPVRQWLHRSRTERGTARGRVNARLMTMTAGRWERARSLRTRPFEDCLREAMSRVGVFCRETAQGISWPLALERLRVWEYTGQARRGYFVRGLSGAQFILSEDYDAVTLALAQPRQEAVWLNAADPAQPWGRVLSHAEGRAFVCVPGTLVGLWGGAVAAVLERQGQTLRVFQPDALPELLGALARDWRQKRLLTDKKRLTLKQYPTEHADALEQAGFARQMMDFCLDG